MKLVSLTQQEGKSKAEIQIAHLIKAEKKLRKTTKTFVWLWSKKLKNRSSEWPQWPVTYHSDPISSQLIALSNSFLFFLSTHLVQGQVSVSVSVCGGYHLMVLSGSLPRVSTGTTLAFFMFMSFPRHIDVLHFCFFSHHFTHRPIFILRNISLKYLKKNICKFRNNEKLNWIYK